MPKCEYFPSAPSASYADKLSVVVTSGYYDPIHQGHLEYLRRAANLADIHIALVNGNESARRKKKIEFQDEWVRAAIVNALVFVDRVMIVDSEDNTVIPALKRLRAEFPEAQMIFAKGGDRIATNTPELDFCDKHGIRFVGGLGAKIASSSEIVERAQNAGRYQ